MQKLVAAFVSLVGLLTLGPPSAFAPTAVEYLYSSGPLGLVPGQAARMGLLVPAVQRTDARVVFFDRGQVLLAQELTLGPGDPKTGPGAAAFFDVSVDGAGKLTITDGTSNTLLSTEVVGQPQVSILIGLLLPAIQRVREAANHMAASVQLVDLETQRTSLALPFIERRHVVP